MSRNILGIDIRKQTLTTVLVDSGLKGPRIRTHRTFPILQNGEGAGQDKIATILESMKNEFETGSTTCILSIPPEKVSFRSISLPFKGRKKIKQVLPMELEPSLLWPATDFVFDFQVLKSVDNQGKSDVLAAVVEKSVIKNYLDTFLAVGIEPDIITFGGFPQAVCLLNMTGIPDALLFLDIETPVCSMFFIISGEIRMIRSFPLSSGGETGNPAPLIAEINRTIQAYNETSGSVFQPETVVFSEGSSETIFSDMGSLIKEAENSLGIPVKSVRDSDFEKTWIQLVDANDQMEENIFPGAALVKAEIDGFRVLNFRTGPFAPKREWAEHKNAFIKTGILAFLVLVLVFTNMTIGTYSQKKRIEDIDNRILSIFREAFPESTKIVDPLVQMRTSIDEMRKKAFLPTDSTGKSVRTIDILFEISSRIPDALDVVFTRLVIGPENILISGETDTFKSVDDIQTQLEKSEFFKKVEISNTGKHKDRIQFKMKVKLK